MKTIILGIIFLTTLIIIRRWRNKKNKTHKTTPLCVRIVELIPGHKDLYYCIEYSYCDPFSLSDYFTRLREFDPEFFDGTRGVDGVYKGWKTIRFKQEKMEDYKNLVDNLNHQTLKEHYEKEVTKEQEAINNLEKRKEAVYQRVNE